MAIAGSAIATTVAISMGFGKHSFQLHLSRDELNNLSLIGQISVTLAICGQAWSKTSFAITLLMISDGIGGKTRIFIWFAAVSMNLLFGIGALMFWIDCTPLEKSWHPLVSGDCWSVNVLVTYGVFTSGKPSKPSLSMMLLSGRRA